MIENVLVGLVVTLLGTLLIYAFRARQLYLVVPRLFSNYLLSTNGKLVELRVFNKGRTAETDVRITLDPELKYEIVASTDSTSKIEDSAIGVPRVPPGDDYSVLLLVEGGTFTNSRISGVSSATTKGRVLEKLDEVPPNAGNALLAVIFGLALLATPIAGIEGFQTWKESKEKKELAELYSALNNSWSDLERYSSSAFAKLYSVGEFPFHQTSITRSGSRVKVTFTIINRAAAELKVSVRPNWPFKDDDPKPWKSSNYETVKVGAASQSTIELELYWPNEKKGIAEFEFSYSVGADQYLGARMKVDIDI
ncbi:hypothetical protein [Shewanella sp. SR43-8]|uniref:hypothetical protein n=1 Tax=Shewanella sp. SR43-8 TaxID=2760938 RepID=UPI001C719795|nr:hypothetical protein [Shewanella sp. SR43-8]